MEQLKTYLLSAVFAVILSLPAQAQLFPVNKSALADGLVYKIGITSNGVHKLTKKMLDDMGVNTGTINPRELKIFGNYGGTLPEALASSYPDDLIEFPILVTGEEDGKFNDNDVVLFYAEGADKWRYDAAAGSFIFDKNIYAEKNYVFLKISAGNGKRVPNASISDNEVSFTTSTHLNHDIFTEDKVNLLGQNLATIGSGKLWVGEYLVNNQEKDMSKLFNLIHVDVSVPAEIILSAYGRSDKESKFTISADGQVFTTNVSAVSLSSTESLYARNAYLKKSVILTSGQPKMSLKYSAAGSGDAWLDYLQVNSTQRIAPGSSQLFVRHPSFANHGFSKIQITGDFTGGVAWDVTDIADIKAYSVASGNVAFASGSPAKQLLLFSSQAAFTPEAGIKINNQNLHSLAESNLLIIYHPDFKESALRLSNHRTSHNGYKVSAVDVNEIYNEFSTGRVDPSAIRNFSKMVYERYPSFRYLLLFGDGSYDYKKLVNSIPAQSFIPVYETDESLNPINAFPTDDYYALLSNNEGANLKGALDIRVGRLPVTSVIEAAAVVDKIVEYDTSPDRFGEWRLKTGFCADDEDGNLHINDADNIANEAFTRDPLYNQQKVYLDAFQQENTPGGERYPDATDAINEQMNQGQLAWCYLGHGGPKGLAQERVVKLSDIQGWNNRKALSLLITATCSFSGYDDPSIASGGELALLNPNGGAIGLLTTTRPVYANENKRLTSSVFKNLYARNEGKGLSFGEIILRSKNATFQDTTGDNTRKFTLLGDPSQILAIPEHTLVLTHINDVLITEFSDTVGALDKLKFRGEVRDYTGAPVTNFNGEVGLTLYDKQATLKTLVNDEDSYEKKFNQFKNVIFKGKASCTAGKFEIECIIPKDINYEIGNSRISMYAHDEVTDAAGYYTGLKLGGSNLSNVNDDTPPAMQLYMNDEGFQYGGITDDAPTLLIKLSDDYGINITGNSIGHDITATITGPSLDEEIVLNTYYEASANDYRKGEVRYPLSDLEPGLYTIKVKAWDIANNSVEGLTEFRVIDKDNQKLVRVYNYPNPFSTSTEFSFEHDLAGLEVMTLINIYTISGKLVKSITDQRVSEGYRIARLHWDARDDFGSNLARGVYLYRIVLTAPSAGLRRESDFMKMVKI
ncbi:MAG: type IX secretion system sortase PorU [Saprospiraceae bacterium]|nr:type IX secretion system sortase PorU [Saprospiraceae bacterium]